MQKKIKFYMVAVTVLMLAILAVNFVMGETSNVSTPVPATNALGAIEKTDLDDNIIISAEQAEDKEQLKELTPQTPEDAERSIYPIRSRFLMWTHDGVHIMWGVYGNGRFAGTDNLGKRCWGVYGKGIFAGFYDGKFFWGKYENGAWKAEYLFDLEHSHGKYVLFPQVTITADNAASQ